MKKFVFSLGPLYVMKENIEKQHKMKLKMIETELGKLAQELEECNIEYERIKTEFCETVIQGIEATKAMDYGRYLLKIKTTMTEVEDKSLVIEKQKEECLEALIEIRREKMMLDKLRQKEYEAYVSATKKEHNKVVEDYFSYKVSVS